MSDQNQDNSTNQQNQQNWRMKVIAAGVVGGAVIGAMAAYLFTQREEDPNARPALSRGDGIRLGMQVMGFLRSIAELGAGPQPK